MDMNLDFLNVNNFQLIIDKIPALHYTAQAITLPSMTLPAVNVPNPFIRYPASGDHIQYSTLNVTFLVDEDLQNYMLIRNWMIGLGFPKDYTDFANFIKGQGEIPRPQYLMADHEKSDITIQFLTNHKNANKGFYFYDASPVALSISPMSVKNTSSEPITANVQFSVRDFSLL